MRSRAQRPLAALSVGLALFAAGLAYAPRANAQDANAVQIEIRSPLPGETIRNKTDMAPLAGLAIAGERPTSFDVVIVLDVSGSTAYPSGIDVDGDGVLGETQRSPISSQPDTPNTDPDDSVLAAEVSASKALLDGLDPSRVHVGVVSFSGEVDPVTQRRLGRGDDALLEQALTPDYAAVKRSLEATLLRGPNGGTNMQAGVKLALRELAGLPGSVSRPRAHAKKVILFLTDGKPSLPFGQANVEDKEDMLAAIDAAQLCRVAGVMLNVYGLGPSAIDYPVAATEMAKATGGLYTPVRRPGDIVAMISGVSFANIEDVVAVNLTLMEWAGPNDVLLSPDGSFQGFVPVRPGLNRIRVSALASDGSRGSKEFDLTFAQQGMSDLELTAERDRIRQRNREIQLRLERERQNAFRKQERERVLEIGIEKPEDAPKPAP
ncbi:MAG: VWA domain-containing protein [Deltaproteobacteria bacterium]|nr:VWA domain-containing protein [Deltaproteobacteria bacterium]